MAKPKKKTTGKRGKLEDLPGKKGKQLGADQAEKVKGGSLNAYTPLPPQGTIDGSKVLIGLNQPALNQPGFKK